MSKRVQYKALENIPAHIPPPPGDLFTVTGGPFDLTWIPRFGRYKHSGKTLGDLIAEDPQYVYHCSQSIPGFVLTPEALAELTEQLEPNDDSY